MDKKEKGRCDIVGWSNHMKKLEETNKVFSKIEDVKNEDVKKEDIQNEDVQKEDVKKEDIKKDDIEKQKLELLHHIQFQVNSLERNIDLYFNNIDRRLSDLETFTRKFDNKKRKYYMIIY